MDIIVTEEILEYSNKQKIRIEEYLEKNCNKSNESLEYYKNAAINSIKLITHEYLFVSTSLSDYSTGVPMLKIRILYVAKTALGFTQEIVTGYYYDPKFIALDTIGEQTIKVDEFYDKSVEFNIYKRCKILGAAVLLDDIDTFKILLDKLGNNEVYRYFINSERFNKYEGFIQYKSIIMKKMNSEIQESEDLKL